MGKVACQDRAADADNVRDRFGVPREAQEGENEAGETDADKPDLYERHNVDESESSELVNDGRG